MAFITILDAPKKQIYKKMIQLSKERILEWQKHFKEHWGVEYTFAEAEEAANNLVGFFDLLLKIDMRENPQKYIKNVNHQRSKKAIKK